MKAKTCTITLDQKIEVMDLVIRSIRPRAREGDPEAIRQHEALKAIAADLQARQSFPTSNALGELRRKIDRVSRSKTVLGYSDNLLADLAYHVINKWPFISQAMERFGEERAE